MSAVTYGRPHPRHASGGWWTGAIPVALAIAGLLAGCAGPSPTPALPTLTPVPSTTPGAGPSASPAAWTALTLPDVPEVARLEPTRSGPGGVAVDTAFRLTSLDGRAPAALAAALVATPPLKLTVAATDGMTATLQPTAPLRPGMAYRFSLARADGTIEGSWAAQAAGPLRIVGTVPGDQAIGVPTSTGIEVTFDQYGVAPGDLEAAFAITPSVAGRFVVSGRTIAFVPTKPLASATIYTVSVRHGLPLAGTGQSLASDLVFAFETSATDDSGVTVALGRPFVDAATTERATVELGIGLPDGGQAPAIVPVTIHRLPTMEAAQSAYEAIRAAPDWSRHSARMVVPVGSLPLVLSADLRVGEDPELGANWIQLPTALDAGWYLLTETYGGVPSQAVVQVTDLATFALLATDRSAIWVNDLATGAPAAGATVSIAGRLLGATDANGLLVAPTPTTLAAGESPWQRADVIVRMGSRAAFRPVEISDPTCGGCSGWVDTNAWWHLFTTDRSEYRQTDTVHAWGVIRNRDTGAVPGAVTVELRAWSNGDAAPPIVSAVATPDRSGAYSARLPYSDIPAGDYHVVTRSGTTVFGDSGFTVGPIVKPAWSLALSLDHGAVLDGNGVTARLSAAFFEGTPVVGATVTVAPDGTSGVAATTGVDGTATATVIPHLAADDTSQWSFQSVSAHPVLPEEAEISADASMVVFRATAVVDATGDLAGTGLSIAGSVHSVDFARYDAPGITDPWTVDPRGAARSGAVVAVRVLQHTSTARQTGTHYDFVLKRVTPVFEYTPKVTTVTTATVKTGIDGSWHLAVTVPSGADRQFSIQATYRDEGGRATTAETWTADHDGGGMVASLENADPANTTNTYSVGDLVRVVFNGRLAAPPVQRYLYAVTRLGLREAVTSAKPTFETPFTAAVVPSMSISAIRFNGVGYEWTVSWFSAHLDLADRRLTVEVTPDAARYAPGGTATVAIRTLDPSGAPVRASVWVQAIDEKLYAIGAAYDSDPLDALYQDVGSGIIGWAASHRTIGDDYGGGMGSAGGSPSARGDFRDWLLAKLVTTGADGRARVTIPLSDDLTSWRVTAAAVDPALEAGSGRAWLVVGLPFFAEATLAPEYLSVDRPSVLVRAFGSALAAAEAVTFTVSSDTLPMTGITVVSSAFVPVEVSLPPLTVGKHRLLITATAGSGATLRTDSLIRTFSVVTTRASQDRTTWAPLDAATTLRTGNGLTSILLVEAGRGRVVPTLETLATDDGVRVERALAAALADRVLVEQFGLPSRSGATADDLSRFDAGGGLSQVSWGSADLDATMLAAMTGDPRLDAAQLGSWLETMFASTAETRERRLLALAGLAALGQPVLPDIEAAAALSDLRAPERISLALAALFAGDEGLARRLERGVLAETGVRSGPYVRLATGAASDPSVETARLAIVAASLGDPVAADMDAWLAEFPPTTTTIDLERALAARGWASRVAGTPAVVALTVDGSRRSIRVEPGSPVALALTPAQAASALLVPISGKVLLVSSWSGPLDPASLQRGQGQAVVRTVSPGGTIGITDTVIVTLSVQLGPRAGTGCWRVTDLVPSGLVPISTQRSPDYDPATAAGFMPDRVTGQRVEWCVSADPHRPILPLRYVARVVTPGTYQWEPAVLQSDLIPDLGLAIDPISVTIGGLGS